MIRRCKNILILETETVLDDVSETSEHLTYPMATPDVFLFSGVKSWEKFQRFQMTLETQKFISLKFEFQLIIQ